MKEILDEIYSQHDMHLIEEAENEYHANWRKVYDMAFRAESKRAHIKILKIAKHLKNKTEYYESV